MPDEGTQHGLLQALTASTADDLAGFLEKEERMYGILLGQSFNPQVPNVARMYDYYLGGKDNFAADRRCADEVLQQAPQVRVMARENREFLGRAVRYLAAEAGIDQFLDLGTGLPTRENVHQVAQRINPDARVVYVDHDPLVLAHARALLADDDRTHILEKDVRAPERILPAAERQGGVDLSRPVAVLLVAVLHFVADHEDPLGIVVNLMDRLPAGSYLVISHVEWQPELEGAAGNYRQASAPVTLRTAQEIDRFFDGLELVEPGVVPVDKWRPDHPAYLSEQNRSLVRGGIGRKSWAP